MLKLKQINKEYKTGELVQHALNNVSLNLRDNEFVAILGPSGSGKTTLLNIIGGLDRYDSGDLVINGISTKKYTDRDWDSYRNHTIGFVFQSYNLIPHQTVLANVELALTISGISGAERRRRAPAGSHARAAARHRLRQSLDENHSLLQYPPDIAWTVRKNRYLQPAEALEVGVQAAAAADDHAEHGPAVERLGGVFRHCHERKREKQDECGLGQEEGEEQQHLGQQLGAEHLRERQHLGGVELDHPAVGVLTENGEEVQKPPDVVLPHARVI